MFGFDVVKRFCNLLDCNVRIVWYVLEKVVNSYLKCEEFIFLKDMSLDCCIVFMIGFYCIVVGIFLVFLCLL